jgi:predicted MFS family arabinose efflux permease
MAMAAVYPLLRADLGVSDVWLGAIGSAFLWTYALGSPLVGWLADRRSRTGMVLLSLVCWSVVTIATGLTRSVWQLVAMRLLLGLAECAYLPAAVGLLADHHASRYRGRAISFHTAGLGIGAVVGTTVAGYLGEHFGWRSAFLLLGSAGLALAAAAVVVLRGRDAPARREEPVSGSIKVLCSVPSYWILLTQAMTVAVGIWLYLNWLPLYFKESYGLSLAGAGFFGAGLMEFPGLLGVIVGGHLSDFVARRNGAARMLVQTVCYVLGAGLLVTFTSRLAFPMVASAVFGFSFLRSIAVANENPLLCDLLPPRQRSTAIGLMNAAQTFSGGIGVFAAGVLKRDFALNHIFAGVSLIVLAAAAITGAGYMWLLPRDLRRRRSFPDSLNF